MKILICGPSGSGKTTLAKPLAEHLNAVLVQHNSNTVEDCIKIKYITDGIVLANKIAIIDSACYSNKLKDTIGANYVVWMDTVESIDFEPPVSVNYHVAAWFDDTPKQLDEVIKSFLSHE